MMLNPASGEHGDAAAYALGALDAAARARFEAHLGECAACRRELASYQIVSDQLALAVPQVEPPPHLGVQIATQARATLLPASAPPFAGATPAPRVAAPSWRRWWWPGQRLSTAIVAASLLVAIFGGGYGVAAHQEVRQNAQSAAQLAEMLQIVYQPGMAWRNLTGTEVVPKARARMCLKLDGTEGVVVAYDLPRLPPSQTYQFWVSTPDERSVSAGTLTVDRYGRGFALVRVNGTFSQYRTVGVTREPARGSARPTGERVLTGQI